MNSGPTTTLLSARCFFTLDALSLTSFFQIYCNMTIKTGPYPALCVQRDMAPCDRILHTILTRGLLEPCSGTVAFTDTGTLWTGKRGRLPVHFTHPNTNHHPPLSVVKGSVQRKLRWVENSLNRSVCTSDCGVGHSFVVLLGFHFDFTIFPFPASTAQFIGEFWKNRRSGASDVAPIVFALHRRYSLY
jgi:hypothetical protein